MSDPSSIYPSWPPTLSSEHARFLQIEINDWAAVHGLAVRPRPEWGLEENISKASYTTAPVTLFPSLLPRKQYEQARSIQRSYNELYARIAGDVKWLGAVVKELAPHDEFIANLWKLHERCQSEGYAQPISLGLFRSDYMVHAARHNDGPTSSLKQVEFNTIASSFGGLASKVSDLHHHLHQTQVYPSSNGKQIRQDSLPENSSIQGLSEGLIAAHRQYGESKSGYSKAIAVIVQDPERNAFDQKHVEYAVQEHGIRIFRISFDQVLDVTNRDANTKALLYRPPGLADSPIFEITTIYYRAGYAPSEYERHYRDGVDPFETRGWQARLHLERSAAIKCPSVLTHLAGCKKVQQILATPGSDHLSHFLQSEEAINAITPTFMPIHPLDDSTAGQEGRRLALDPEESQRFVLKPQREGGGNNVYRGKIPDFLRSQDEKAWAQYILMEMIETPPQRNVIMRDGILEEGGIICELGCYGAVLWNEKGEMLYNEEAGTLLRTKGDQSEEGGVAAGFGAVDSPCLVDLD